MTLLILGLVIFLGVHSISIVAPGLRARLAGAIGEGPYKGLYGVVSIIGFVLLIWGFGAARQSPVLLYTPPPWMRHVTFLFMLPVFPLVLAAYFPGRIKAATKHPMLVAVKLWAIAHLLSNGTAADLVLFGSFLVWAGLDRMSLKRRPAQRLAVAPARPFNDALAIVAGLGLYVFFIAWAHLRLFGVSPLG